MINDIQYKWFSIEDIYNYCRENALPLLSTFSAPFWGQYILDYEKYDRYFAKRYRDFIYYNQHPINNTDIDSVTMDFIESVQDFLLVHEKNYTELFKIQLLNFGNDIQYDFYSEETVKNIRSVYGDYIFGSRSDRDTNLYGGSTDSVSNTIGSYTVSTNDTTEKQKMAFDSSSYVNDLKDKSTGSENVSSRTDRSNATRGSRTDTLNKVKGEQTDNKHENENGKRSSTTKGYNNNPIKNIELFRKYWNGYSFYGDIFYDISRELLVV